jgi:hypothetical protein
MVGRVSSLTEQKLSNIELFLSLKMNFNYLKKFIINLTREQIGNKRGGRGKSKNPSPTCANWCCPLMQFYPDIPAGYMYIIKWLNLYVEARNNK